MHVKCLFIEIFKIKSSTERVQRTLHAYQYQYTVRFSWSYPVQNMRNDASTTFIKCDLVFRGHTKQILKVEMPT